MPLRIALRIAALAPTPNDQPRKRARGRLRRGRGGDAPPTGEDPATPVWRGRPGRGGDTQTIGEAPAAPLWRGLQRREAGDETPERGAARRGRRSRGVLAALAGLLAAAGVALLVLSGSDDGPLVVDVASPAGLAVADGRVWVTSPRAGTVTPVDASGEVGAPLRVGGAPARIVAGANGLWVTDAAAGSVVPIKVPGAAPPNAAVAPAPGIEVFDAIAAGPTPATSRSPPARCGSRARADRRVYAVEQGGHATGIEAGEGPIALAADARRVVVVDARAGSITVIDARKRAFVGQVRVGGTPVDVALAGDAAWVADAAGARLVRVDLGSLRVTHTLAIGRRPIALASAGDDLYALVAGDRSLVKVTRGVVQWRRSLPGPPTALAVDARHVWVGAGQLLRFDR